jgi:hypothetical protein
MGAFMTAIFVIFTAAVVGGMGVLVKLWNVPPSHPSYSPPDGWACSAGLFHAWRRSGVPLMLGGFLVIAAAVAPEPWLTWVAAVFAGVYVPLILSVALFNRPKLIVPPGARHQTGLAKHALRRISRSEQS